MEHIEIIGWHGVRVGASGGVRIGPAAQEEGERVKFQAYTGIVLEPTEALALLAYLEQHREKIEDAVKADRAWAASQKREVK